VYPISKTEAEWKKQLSSEAYYVLRQAGTERPFTSALNNEKRKGTFHCAACNTPLFKSDHKFDSGTGWPSFDREIKGNVAYGSDNKLGYSRDEEHCATCGGHLGHVFNDGPRKTTGKRHCINGVALTFVPETL
jgi:peptide-methionine (R)-S-oxide reductase